MKKELLRFLMAGCMAVLTDFLSYEIFLNFLDHNMAKGLSFLCGTISAFFLNKFWTFESEGFRTRENLKFLGLYVFTLFANINVNHAILSYDNDLIHLAFLAATGTSTILNFLGQKFWVFKRPTGAHS